MELYEYKMTTRNNEITYKVKITFSVSPEMAVAPTNIRRAVPTNRW